MTPRKEPGNAMLGKEFRREHRNVTPRREKFRIQASTREGALVKRVELACDKKTQTLGESYIKGIKELRSDVSTAGGNGVPKKQVEDEMNKEGCADKMAIEEPSHLEAQLVEREKKMEDLSRALALREKQLEVREIQVKVKESDMAKSRQNIMNIKNIIDEKQILSRKLSDMEQELQRERASRKEAESVKEEAEYNVQKVALRLEASLLQEGQVKSELMTQCQVLGSELHAMAEEMEMSRKTVEMLSLEVEKWRRMAQDGKSLNKDFSSKEAKEVCLLTSEEVNCRSDEVSSLKASEVVEVEVSGEAGRRKGEALDLLRIQEDDENPKSGSRMDFGEKKVFFQKKIEAEISSPSLRDRK